MRGAASKLAARKHTRVSEEDIVLNTESELDCARGGGVQILNKDEKPALSGWIGVDGTAKVGIVNDVNLVKEGSDAGCARQTDGHGKIRGQNLVGGGPGLNPLGEIGVGRGNVGDSADTNDSRDGRGGVHVDRNTGRKNRETFEEGGVLVEAHGLMTPNGDVGIEGAVDAVTDIVESTRRTSKHDSIGVAQTGAA